MHLRQKKRTLVPTTNQVFRVTTKKLYYFNLDVMIVNHLVTIRDGNSISFEMTLNFPD